MREHKIKTIIAVIFCLFKIITPFVNKIHLFVEVVHLFIYNKFMRQQIYFEAYLEDFNKITVYMSKQSYEGQSKFFYLQDELGNMEELMILTILPTSRGYNKYTLRIPHAIALGHEYTVWHQGARQTVLKTGYIVKTKKFDELYAYTENDLGANYTKNATRFVLWSPTASKAGVYIKDKYYEMKKGVKGTFTLTMNGDLHLVPYYYHIYIDGAWVETLDPYGKSSCANSKYSVVIDESRIQGKTYNLPSMQSNTDAILYEASIRDFTSQANIGITHPAQYLGFVEENETTKAKRIGFSYLKELGITHVQLLPILDFASVDEKHPDLYYNWGYDPIQYMTLEGSYSSNPEDAFARMQEFRTLVDKCHEAGLRVVLDVVFNHVFELDTMCLQKMVPNYYFQINEHGQLSNGSWCGNDMDSTRIMARKYILDCCKHLASLYQIDGLRFDLMGVLDIDTINLVKKECSKIRKHFMVYGEGWNMPCFLDEEKRASIFNEHCLEDVAMFSDRFRDVVKGKTNIESVCDKGYCTGDTQMIGIFKDVLTASSTAQYWEPYFSSPQHVINYVECHDNQTCWDKLKECCKEDTRENRMKRHCLCIAATLFAQGIPFIHCGQEFARTKYGKHNTYNDSDKINCVDYDRRDKYNEIVEFTKQCILIRKSYRCFAYKTTQEIKDHVYFEDIEGQGLAYRMKDDENDMVVCFNPTLHTFNYYLNDDYQMLFYDGLVKEERIYRSIQLQPLSVVVLRKRENNEFI